MTTQQNEKVTMDSLLGPKLLVKADGGAKPTKTLLKDKSLVALYFSASWCPPCKTFSPLFREFYNAAAKEKGLEVVYVSSDKDMESFKEYVSGELRQFVWRRGNIMQQFLAAQQRQLVWRCGLEKLLSCVAFF